MSRVAFPEKPSGRPSNDYYEQMQRFANDLEKVQSRLTFRMSARGWAYYLENEGVITKSEIDYAEDKINDLRKNDFGKSAPWEHAPLPVDFTAQDDSRRFACVESTNFDGAESYIESRLDELLNPEIHTSFWEQQDCYIQVLVEKVDLKELFKPICDKYNIPIATAKGWSSINQRAGILGRFYKWYKKGNAPVLLYCGDFDPAGLQISNKLRKNLSDLDEALIPVEDEYVYSLSPDAIGLQIDRFGLNYQQVQQADLPWINNLETSSGEYSLDDPRHPEHDQDYVQNWLDEYGVRKVESNALVTEPELGRGIFRETVESYLGEEPEQAQEQAQQQARNEIRNTLSELGVEKQLRDTLSEIGGDGQ